jgi:hypothetical protein
MDSVENKIIKRIKKKGSGWVFCGVDFRDIASPDAVRQALVRLHKRKVIRRIAAGVFDCPKHSFLLKSDLSPDISLSAQAFARKFAWHIQPSGSAALNYLGLSTQVPGKIVYFSDGPNRKYKIGNTILSFQKNKMKYSFLKSMPSILIAQAVDALKNRKDDLRNIDKIRSQFKSATLKKVLHETKGVPAHVYKTISVICKGKK